MNAHVRLSPAELADCARFAAEQAAGAIDWRGRPYPVTHDPYLGKKERLERAAVALRIENARRSAERQDSYDQWGQSR